jgi:ankyrin repeat protein
MTKVGGFSGLRLGALVSGALSAHLALAGVAHANVRVCQEQEQAYEQIEKSAGPIEINTALWTAADKGCLALARRLLEAGASLEARDGMGRMALARAARAGHAEIVELFLARGAPVNARNLEGSTALFLAAEEDNRSIVETLVKHGADLSLTGRSGLTPLAAAAYLGNEPLVRLLLERGADPNASGAGYAPLHWAAGSWETAFTANDITTDREGEHDWNALVGLKDRRLELVGALLDHGADPNARVKTTPPRAGATRSPTLPELAGATPFVLAAMAGDVAVMRRLKEAGADPSLTTSKRSTALMAAAGLGRILGENTLPEPKLLEAATLALELGADVRAADDFGNTALHYAAYHRLTTLVQLLVAKGADLEAKNMFGETPLWAADLVIQWFGGGTFKVVPTPTGDLLRKLGARPIEAPYPLRPADWPCNEIPPAPVPKACS